MNFVKSVQRDFLEVQLGIRFEFVKALKNNRLATVFGISTLLAMLFYLIPVLTSSGFPESADAYMANVLGFVSLAIVLFAMFLGSDAINREHAEVTDLLLFPLPQRRVNVIISKFVGSILLAWTSLLLFYSLVAGTVGIVYGFNAIPYEMVNSFLMAMVYTITLMAFAFFLSAVLKSPSSSLALTFFGVQILLPLLNLLLGLADIDVSWIFSNYSSLITETMGLASQTIGPGVQNSGVDFNEGLFQLAWQATVMFFASLLIGTRREVGE